MRVAFVPFVASTALFASWCGDACASPADPRPGPQKATVDRWVAEDAAALRRAPRGSHARVIHFASLLNGLWIAGRDGELQRELASAGARFPRGSNPEADQPFFRGDRSAAFTAYGGDDMRRTRALARSARWSEVIPRLRTAHPEPAFPDRGIAAALLEGDAYAACGRWPEARTTWYRAFSTAVYQPSVQHRFFPEWTSALWRLVHYRSAAGRPSAASGCRALPAPIVDPID